MKAVSAGCCDSLTIVAIGLTVFATACSVSDRDPPPFTLRVSPESVSTPAGSRIGTTVITTRNPGAQFPIWVYDVTPSGIHSVLPVDVGRGNSTPAEYVVDDSVAPGPRVVAFSAYADEQPLGTKVVIRRATLTIHVTPYLGRFRLATVVPPTPPPVPRGERASVDLVIVRTAPFNGPVQVAAAASVQGVVVALDPPIIPSNAVSTRLTVSAATDAPIGALSVTVRMTGSDVPPESFFLIFTVVP